MVPSSHSGANLIRVRAVRVPNTTIQLVFGLPILTRHLDEFTTFFENAEFACPQNQTSRAITGRGGDSLIRTRNSQPKTLPRTSMHHSRIADARLIETLEQLILMSATGNDSLIEIYASGSEGTEQMQLQIDGETVETFDVGQETTRFVFQADEHLHADQIRIAFANDLYDGDAGIDRNLIVDRIVVDGETFETEDASTFSTGTWTAENGVTDGYWEDEWLHTNGYFQFADTTPNDQSEGNNGGGNSAIEIIASGDMGTEAMQVIVNGNVVDTIDVSTELASYSIQLNQAFDLDSDVLRIAMSGSLWNPDTGIDENLNVDKVIINGTTFETEAASTLSTGTWTAASGITAGYWQNETLHADGYFEYSTSSTGGQPGTPDEPVEPPTEPPTTDDGSVIEVVASGDMGQENMSVSVNGQVAATFNVTTTSTNYTVQFDRQIQSSDQIRVLFSDSTWDPDNNIDENLNVDRIVVDGVAYETEDPSTVSTGTWVQGVGFEEGNWENETLHTDGYFQYDISGDNNAGDDNGGNSGDNGGGTDNEGNNGHDHGGGDNDGQSDDGPGYFVFDGNAHDFVVHASTELPDLLIEGQQQYGGYAFVSDNYIVARNTITGLQPVVEQAIDQIEAAHGNRNYDAQQMERLVAQQITQLNDWEDLTTQTQNAIMIQAGLDYGSMTRAEREDTINHLLHSPLPFGDITEPLSSNVRIDLGYTHTLDKNETTAEDLGNGMFRITLISNNNNGSHTGHRLGSFVVNLGPFASESLARDIGNDMVINTNNNARLYLDNSAREVMSGNIERMDFTQQEFHGAGEGHDFVAHASHNYPEVLHATQQQYGGYAWIGARDIVAQSTITGLEPVIQQAIDQVHTAHARLIDTYSPQKIENLVAQQITNLNDWENLTSATQNQLMIQTRVDFESMSRTEREATINHLLHSPLPFGDIQEVLSEDTRIDLGYTHTLSKNDTTAADLGDGKYRITLISNNNNGSHTGHRMGSFVVDLGETTIDDAIGRGNDMVINKNNNAKLTLDQAARNVLWGTNIVADVDDTGVYGNGTEYTEDREFEYDPNQSHDFASHVSHTTPEVLAPGQDQYGGYSWVSETDIMARVPITGLRPVIEQAIEQVQAAQPRLEGEALESAIANQLTNLNDWENLTVETQNAIMIMTGIDYGSMSRAEREATINHLLHSPIPFGDIEETLASDVRLHLGFTHTLDKNETEVEDLGEGRFRIVMISNNNNGSHTGHRLGSFVVQLGDVTLAEAKSQGNSMVINTNNNNNELYLDQAARDILWGRTEDLDFTVQEFHGVGDAHDFVTHASHNYPSLLVPTQAQYGGHAFVGNTVVGRSTITGLMPVVEQAISDVERTQPNLTGQALESAIANRLTQLNDWENLTTATQNQIMMMSGIDFDSISRTEREATINHLLHSPLPFADLTEPLSSNMRIDLGYTHTLDKNDTIAEDLGDGLYKITLISDNANGSHTGHRLGSFVVDFGEELTLAQAKQRGNAMVSNTNNNNQLYLDQAARAVLYGWLPEETTGDDQQHDGGHNHG